MGICLMILLSCGTPSDHGYQAKEIPEADSLDFDATLLPDESTASPYDPNQESMDLYYQEGKVYALVDTIQADFNGDGQSDRAIFQRTGSTSGILILDGISNKEIRLGFGRPFAHFSDFNWVDYWGLIQDSVTFEIIVEDSEVVGSEPVRLENPAIYVGVEESGGGLVTFMEGNYVWVHQAD